MGALDVLVSLFKVVAVFGLLLMTLRLLGRSKGLRGGSRTAAAMPGLEILDKTRLGRTSAVVTVRIGERALLLGVTETQITTLADVTDDVPPPEPEPEVDLAGGERTSVIDHALEVLRAGVGVTTPRR